jgi:general secretion pathway protein F
MTNTSPADVAFRYTALDRGGRRVKDVVLARDLRAASRALSATGLTPLSLREEKAAAKRTGDRGLKFTERVAVLSQLALMVEAGVSLLESVDTVAAGIVASRGKAQFEAVMAALKRGEAFARAMETHAPGFPFYVYAMMGVGEATGRLGEVLNEAASQMAYEDRLRRDFINALTYPAFLLAAGLSAVFFIFTQVVPRFSAMIGDKRDKMPAISKLVLDVGEAANTHMPLVLLAMGTMGAMGVFAALNPRIRQALYDFGHGVPVVGDLLRAREISSWARLTGFALQSGVGLLESAALARRTTPEGAFRRGLEQFERDLKAGVAVDVSLGRNTRLTIMDLSLLRAGQKSGALGKMFNFLSDAYDAKLKDNLKRLTALVEPIAIGMISILVGAVALSLILALSSVYDSVF